MDALDSVFDPLRDFAKDSVRLVKRCHKPDRKGELPLVLMLISNDYMENERMRIVSNFLNFDIYV